MDEIEIRESVKMSVKVMWKRQKESRLQRLVVLKATPKSFFLTLQ